MSLRLRLVSVSVLLIATYVATAVVVVSSQRALLIDQIDERLRSLPPDTVGTLTLPPPVPVPASGETERATEPANPFTELFIGLLDASGMLTVLTASALLEDVPDAAAAVAATQGAEGLVTVPSLDGATRFRVLVVPQPGVGAWLIAAQALTEIDAAIARLVRTLWIAGAVIALVLGVAFFWIERLGLRPIARVTAAAEAIAAGERAHRVAVADRGTEAGKLGHAFNVMLDERDASELRLRQFVADASHELRTPLTSVRGYLELYRQGAFQERAQLDDVVRRLSAESVRMHDLVEDLFALASLDEGRPLRAEVVDLGQVVRDAAQDARAVQPARPLAVAVPEAGPRVTGDPGLLTQLVGILVSNALAHTPVAVAVTLGVARQGAEVVLTVADEGPGLDAEAASRVFDRFWRGQAARTRGRGGGRGGAGLGLAIARSIVEAHGGTIALTTAPGEGCRFTVRLPPERTAEPPESADQPSVGTC